MWYIIGLAQTGRLCMDACVDKHVIRRHSPGRRPVKANPGHSRKPQSVWISVGGACPCGGASYNIWHMAWEEVRWRGGAGVYSLIPLQHKLKTCINHQLQIHSWQGSGHWFTYFSIWKGWFNFQLACFTSGRLYAHIASRRAGWRGGSNHNYALHCRQCC